MDQFCAGERHRAHPARILLIWVTAAGLFSRTTFDLALSVVRRHHFDDLPCPGSWPSLASTLVSVLFRPAVAAAVTATTEVYLHGEVPTLRGVYAQAARHLFGLLVATVVLLLALTVLTTLATLCCSHYRSRRAGRHRPVGRPARLVAESRALAKGWVKWLIILTAPFGLAAYFSFRWSMYLVAIMLEDCGPIGALQRSSQLTDRHWFRVASVLVVSGLIVAVLRSVLTLLVSVPLSVSSTLRGELGPGVVESAIDGAVGILVQILFASVGSVVYTLLFVDLRNRREGTDMAERLTQLEASPITPGE